MKRKFAGFCWAKCPQTREVRLRKNSSRMKICSSKSAVAEDELIESYIRGTLSPAEKTILSANFCQPNHAVGASLSRARCSTKLHEQNEIAVAKKTETADGESVRLEFDNRIFQNAETRFRRGVRPFTFNFRRLVFTRNPNQPEIAKQITPTPTAEIITPIQNQNSTTNQNDSGI